LYSCPNKFSHSSPEAPRIIQMRETSTSESANYPPILPVGLNFTRMPLGFFTCRKWLFYGGFFGCPKNSTASAGFEPAKSMLTTRPPKPSNHYCYCCCCCCHW
jgi:hypothetical protein